jgi:hypothetical protein
MVCGAKMIINDLTFEADQRVKLPHSMDKIERYELPGLQTLRSFVDNYDESIAELRIRSLIPIKDLCDLDSLWGEVQTEVRSLCLTKVGKESSDLEPEPGFILGLRALNNTLARFWAERF